MISIFKTAWKNRNVALLATILAAFAANLLKTHTALIQYAEKRRAKPYAFIGDQFNGIKKYLINVPRIGYYTDRSMDDALAAAKFAQAQYSLIPTILELNSLDHPLVIVDLKDIQNSLITVQSLGLKPVSMSNTGIILAENPTTP